MSRIDLLPTVALSSSSCSTVLYISLLALLTLSWKTRRTFAPPPTLQHLPSVPIWPLLCSYFSGEQEAQRIRRLIMPCVRGSDDGLVLVWSFGTWMIHCVDPKIAKQLMESRAFKKQPPPKHMLFWKLTGLNNVVLLEGEAWRRHARVLRSALTRSAPIPHFVQLSEQLFSQLDLVPPVSSPESRKQLGTNNQTARRICWSDFTHRFSLDAIGVTVMGHDFEALSDPDSPFVSRYHRVMASCADPLYLFLPFLENLLPRKRAIAELDALVDEFRKLLISKKSTPGEDFISYMLEESGMTDEEHRDNIITLFMAGHDTTAGALSTIVYCLAKHPEIQRRARQEVMTVLGSEQPTAESLLQLPYMFACIREAIRFNTPSTSTIPRIASESVILGNQIIPPGTPVMLNLYGCLQNPEVWSSPEVFDPERFLGSDKEKDGTILEEEGSSIGWIPFGLGMRRCPARTFSLFEQRTLIAMLLREYEWTLPAESKHSDGILNAFSAFALNLPEDLDIIFTRLST